MMHRILSYIKQNWVLLLILLLGAFFRLYNIDGYMTFLGDEGRDVIIVRNLLTKADPILIGPGTSVGGMYLGPLYYYFMAPFLLLANFSPVGPAVGVAILGVATIYLVYVVGRDWFGRNAGIISALLFAISPTVITYSHSSWNPNIMPFFALLSIYSVWKVWKRKQYYWLIITAISFAFVCQSHYLGVLLAPVLFIYWLLASVPKRYTLISILLFSFLMSPLLAFDIRHDWMNSRALYKFLTVREETVAITPSTAIPKAYPIFEQINGSMLTAKNQQTARVVSIIIFAYLVFLYTGKDKIIKRKYLVPVLWYIFGLIGFGLYKQSVYDHYFGFLFPVPFLLLGGFFEDRLKLKSRLMTVTLISALLYLVFLNLKNNPLLNQPNNQMQRAKNVSDKVLEIAEGKPFNLAVLADRNYEDGYRYFITEPKKTTGISLWDELVSDMSSILRGNLRRDAMELANAQVMHADRWDRKTIVENLIVICEKPKEKCDPTHSPKAEVANFGWSKIDSDFEVDGVIIYKLIHAK